jgi:hypothetical protein
MQRRKTNLHQLQLNDDKPAPALKKDLRAGLKAIQATIGFTGKSLTIYQMNGFINLESKRKSKM